MNRQTGYPTGEYGTLMSIAYVSLNFGYRSSFAGLALVAAGTRKRSRLGQQVLGRAGRRWRSAQIPAQIREP